MSCSIVTNPMAATQDFQSTNPEVAAQDFQGSRQNLGACGSTATFYYLGYIRIKYIRQGGSGKSEVRVHASYPGLARFRPSLASVGY